MRVGMLWFGLFVVFLGSTRQVPEWSEQDRVLPSSLEAGAVRSAELETERPVPACVCSDGTCDVGTVPSVVLRRVASRADFCREVALPATDGGASGSSGAAVLWSGSTLHRRCSIFPLPCFRAVSDHYHTDVPSGTHCHVTVSCADRHNYKQGAYR
jgi:hypothetical protein